MAERPYRILTVGDGNFSFSYALKKAYGDDIDLVASTVLPDVETLKDTYPTAHNYLSSATLSDIRYGVDATQLHRHFQTETFDMVMFQHPHLGERNDDEQSEAEHVHKHHVLLAHYLASASSILSSKGRVQLSLKPNQAENRRLYEAALRIGLIGCPLIGRSALPTHQHHPPTPVHYPLHLLFPHKIEPRQVKESTIPRQARMSRTTSRDWLTRYGYRPVRTLPNGSPMDVAGTCHYVFERGKHFTSISNFNDKVSKDSSSTGSWKCPICWTVLDTQEDFLQHQLAPALPHMENTCQSKTPKKGSNDTDTQHHDITPIEDTNSNKEHANRRVVVSDQACPGGTLRLRAFLQQELQRSKRDCQRLISSRCVTVEGAVVADSGRLLQPGTVVEVNDIPLSISPSRLITILDSWSPTCIVVWKPVGMRTIGSFDENTLEQLVSKQLKSSPYVSLTKLDTGVSGLCVLAAASDRDDTRVVTHTFTALVFGSAPLEWDKGITTNLPVNDKRRWKSHTRPSENNQGDLATVRCLERTKNQENLPSLSTVCISTDSKVSGLGNVICSFLRRDCNLPVVGDRFASKEYKMLPRFLTYRLKNRLCLSCTRVWMGDCRTEQPVPDRWRAGYWEALYVQTD